jgi:hypothetical protein
MGMIGGSTNNSSNITLQNAASSFPSSLNPLHMPASSKGRLSKYNLTLSAVNAQRYCAHHNGREVDRVKTVRCTSFGQPRNWHQMVTMIPVNPFGPPNSPLRNPMPPSAETPTCIGLNAGRGKPYMP